MKVYILLRCIEYEGDAVLGVFSLPELAEAKANKLNKKNGHEEELKDYGRDEARRCLEPYEDSYSFFAIEEHEVKGDSNE